ncbi:MAG: flavodoxin family protein [Solirubrobacteraceae bacterium]
MSANIAIIYSGAARDVAEAFGEAAGHLARDVRLLPVSGDEDQENGWSDGPAGLGDLEWADGIAFGTPIANGNPAPVVMRFIQSTEPLWSSGRLYEKAVTVFTDEPEHFAPDSVLHPIYDAFYHWGAVIVGPRTFELELDAQPDRSAREGGSPLPGPRLRTARYRAIRLARLAGVLADERRRRERLEL